ncbi:MAG: glycogen debranching enzyme family protein, partial [Gammaproteobacteria bacterium]|nr:glycogen debranching enzyme family protein [Gammaproteobacteria bacterium]
GYACGTVALANTRRYHGLLIASLAPPIERRLLVAKFDASVLYDGRSHALGANEFADGTVAPQGFVHLQSFELRAGIPTWRYAFADALLELKIFMAPLAATSYASFTLLRASAPVRLEIAPFVTFRDHHQQARGALAARITHTPASTGDAVSVEPAAAGARAYRLVLQRGRFEPAGVCYFNFRHREEEARGLDSIEDLWMPGRFTVELAAGERSDLIATAEDSAPAEGAQVERQVELAGEAACAALPATAPPWVRQLARAADQFLVRRGARGEQGAGVIAGYPWFDEWSRDTMISLPGLATALGRHEIAAEVLRTYARQVDGGMLPNTLPAGESPPAYNTADATLWLFHALDEHLAAHPDPALERELLPVLIGIIRAHVAGTRFQIRVDAADGLLRAGAPGTQLTWMDAKQGERAFTSRAGKPVEINALWLNALDVTMRLANRGNERSAFDACRRLRDAAGAGFGRFWNASAGCLYDVIDVDGGSGVDASIRPNQLLAASLPYSVLTAAERRAVVSTCARELLTSYGLRSLSPRDGAYLGRYLGDAFRRDASYHQGTVWTWLLGPFAWAHFLAYGDARAAQSFLQPLGQALSGDCMGSLGEIFDGDAPHPARGCFAQAWSVAETLRAWIRLERLTRLA